MKKEMEEIPDELNPDLMLNTIASELLIKIAKGEIDIQKLVRKQLSGAYSAILRSSSSFALLFGL